MKESSNKVIIIGAGVAGTATAIRLAASGMEVTVYDKNPDVGGKLTLLQQDGFTWDKGPSLFTQPQNIEALFEVAGVSTDEFFKYSAQDIACHYFYEDGTIVNAYTNSEAFAGELAAKNGEEETVIKSYLQNAADAYESIGTIFLKKSLHRIRTWLHGSVLRAIKKLKLSYLTSSMHKYNAKAFSHPRTAQLFDRFATYNGSNPYKAPAMLCMIAHLEHNEGTYYAHGGMISIPRAMKQLADKLGVQFCLNQPVDSIITNAGQALGVRIGEENIMADVVVSNSDVYFTYKNLLQDSFSALYYKKQERSSSAYIFYWGISAEFKQLGLHNILFAEDYKAEFDCIFNKKILHSDPTIYINISSKLDTEQAPAGAENWFVMVNVPAGLDTENAEVKETLRKNIIDKINRILHTDIESKIVSELECSPSDIEQDTMSYLGALYGTSSNHKKAAFLRHPNFSNKIKNLYFCGGTVHPGGGIPLCLSSAAIVAGMVEKKVKPGRK